jgi:hypothetical protein
VQLESVALVAGVAEGRIYRPPFFSIAFFEKIVDFANASLNSRRWLLSAWQCFIAAIVACGIGLCFITLAGGAAVYGSDA